MPKLQIGRGKERLPIILQLEGTELRKVEKKTELLPDFDLVSYGGLDDKEYPIWLEFDLRQEFTFIHKVILEDYGYITDEPFFVDDELPKFTSGSPGTPFAQSGKLNMFVQSVDLFGCRVSVRGQLYGSSAEMNIDVGFNFKIAGYSRTSSKFGFAAEAIAEGFAFENEGRLKQAFFSYFTAIDSFLEAERERANKKSSPGDQIPETDRLPDKLAKLVRRNANLNEIRFWGPLMGGFKDLVGKRNAIAHNLQDLAIGKMTLTSVFPRSHWSLP